MDGGCIDRVEPDHYFYIQWLLAQVEEIPGYHNQDKLYVKTEIILRFKEGRRAVECYTARTKK